MTIFEAHLELAKAQHAILLFLCLCGLLLNSAMLVIFFTKKQVRGSIYTTYMIQIAITDLLVCMVWIVISSVYLTDLPRNGNVTDVKMDEASTESEVAPESRNILLYRFTFAVYYFHYYNNIFLLATMSVERCVAVWKSLRCQRYQFNRKFVYGVSVTMWLLAFFCALPSFVDPDLIITNEQTDLLLRDKNASSSFLQPIEAAKEFSECIKPFEYSVNHNLTYVKDCGDVSVKNCLELMLDYSYHHYYGNNGNYLSDLDEGDTQSSYSVNYEDGDEEVLDPPQPESDDVMYYIDDVDGITSIHVVSREPYHHLLHHFLGLLENKTKESDIDEICDPSLSPQAKIYHILVNLVIGFFLPFLAIVTSYSAIAYMIGRRAKLRMESDDPRDESSIGRRMSDFLKQFASGGNNKSVSNLQLSRDSPVLRRNLRKTHERNQLIDICNGDVIGDNDNLHHNIITDNNNSQNDELERKVVKTTTVKASLESKSPNLHLVSRGERPHLSSLQMKRVSRGSASSAESFPTEQTSLQTSPSPGVHMSVPSFTHHDKTLVQRASSADTATNGQYYILPATARRWSSEEFRSSTLITDDERKGYPLQNIESAFDNHNDKVLSLSPSRVENSCNDSPQEMLHSSHTRLYQPKRRSYNRQHSGPMTSRSRAYSAASRGSAGGGTLRKTIVHKNAERHLRVSRTVIAYVITFSLCWLPQRITTFIYVTEGLVGMAGYHCHLVTNLTRIISFFSVLLNPIVYAVTQQEVLLYMRNSMRRIFKCLCPHRIRDKISKQSKPNNTDRQLPLNGNENANFSNIQMNIMTSDIVTKRERRREKNRETRSRLVSKLGRKNITGSVPTNQVEKHSDGTIDEERDEDRISKGQSSTNSYKTGVSWKGMMEMAGKQPGNKIRKEVGETAI